jgi:thioredoxin reductase (NADPH)
MISKFIKILLFFILAGVIAFFSYHYSFSKPQFTLEKALEKNKFIPVLIIGSGPAGLSAALYTARAKLPTIVLSGDQPGGTLADVREIENWPGKRKASGEDTIEDLENQAMHFGADLINDTVESIDLSSWPYVVKTRDGKTINALTIIIATGRIAKTLDVPGVKEFWGHGVGVCTICDAPFHKDHDVAVVGGGDTAGDRALQLAAFANKVYMIVKDSVLDASGFVQDYIKKNPKIEVLYNTELQEIMGKDDSVTGAKILDSKTRKSREISIKGIYFAIGWHPNSDLVQKQLKLQNGGFIWVDGQTQHTSKSGVFAVGDVMDPLYGKAGVSTGSGIKGGMDAIKFLQKIGIEPGFSEKYPEKIYKYESQEQQEIPTIIHLAELKNIITQTKNPIILDFYTDSCPSCKALMPHLKTLAAQYAKNIKIIKVNFEKAHEIVKEYSIASVPYLVVLNNGKEVKRSKTIRTKDSLEKLIKSILEKE